MRAFEFLKEATLDSSTTYTSWPGYLSGILRGNISLGVKGEKKQGLELDDQSKQEVERLIAGLNKAADKRAYGNQIANTSISFVDGTSAKIKEIFKSADLKGSTDDSPKLQTRTAGLVSEGLLGAAMFAKLTARGGELTEAITSEDVWNVVSKLNADDDTTLTESVLDIDNKVSDSINLIIRLAVDVKDALLNPSYRPLFEDKVSSWVSYVNSDLAQKYADILYKNNRPDNITIRLEGMGGGKVDVVINVLDKEGNPTKKLEQVKLSVKLADSLIGQQARGKSAEEVYDNLQKLFSPLDIDFSEVKQDIIDGAMSSGIENQFAKAMEIAYRTAFLQLRSDSDNLSGDTRLVEKVAKLTDFHATSNDPEIQVIEQTPDSDYRLLNYKGLKKVLEQNNIDIDVEFTLGSSSKIEQGQMPRIRFFNANDKGPKGRLLDIRFRARGNYANHIIEPGSLLKELAAYRRFQTNKS